MLWIASTSVEERRCSDPWRDAKAIRLWVGQCTGFSCNSQQNWLNHILIMFFCWSIVVDQFFSDLFLIWYPAQSGCFEYVLYDSSRRAIVSMILTSTSIRIHPKAMHPYPLYIHFIAFLASCSNLASSNPSEKVHLTLGPWATAAPVSLAATRRWAWQMMANVSFIGCAENALAMTCDRGFRCKTSCLQQRQMIYKKCLKLVGRKWFSFRRLLMAGRSTVFSQTNAPLHSVFSCILPCVMACEAY